MKKAIFLPNIGDQVWLITSRHTEPLLTVRESWEDGVEDPDVQFVDIGVEDLVHETNAG